jgi:hypothetical protein
VDDVLKRQHAAVDNGQPGSNAACLDPLAILAAKPRSTGGAKSEAATINQDMTTLSAQRAADVLVVLPAQRNHRFVYRGSLMKCAMQRFGGL